MFNYVTLGRVNSWPITCKAFEDEAIFHVERSTKDCYNNFNKRTMKIIIKFKQHNN